MLRSTFFFLSFLLAALSATAQDYAIHAGTLVDGTGSAAQHDVYLVIREGRIASISRKAPIHIFIKEFPKDTVIPGLVDAHGHIAAIGLGEEADARLLNEHNQEQWVVCNARDALASGVTTLRDAGTYLWTLAMRARIEGTGLRWITAGRQLVKKTTDPNAYMDSMFVEFDGVEDARTQVRARKAEGSQWIKLRLTSQRPLPSLEEARAIVDEAHKLGMRVGAHTDIPDDAAVQLAIDAGADSIEHNGALRVSDPDKTLAAIARHKMFIVPGMGNAVARWETAWVPPKDIPEEPLRSKLPPELVKAMQSHALELKQQVLEMEKSGFDPQKRILQARQETLRAINAGVNLAAGPDTGVDLMPHGRLYKDIEWYLDSGVPLEKVVEIATLNGARDAGVEQETGSLEVGKTADVVVLRGNLSKHPDFRHVLLVMRADRKVFDASIPWKPCDVK